MYCNNGVQLNKSFWFTLVDIIFNEEVLYVF